MSGIILIDCLGVLVGEQRGSERFICRLAAELATRTSKFKLIVNRRSYAYFAATVGPERCIVVPISGTNRVVRMIVQVLAAPLLARYWGSRLYVSTSVFPVIAMACRTAVIVYDLMLYHFPEEFARQDWRNRTALLKLGLPQFGAVFTISHASARDIRARFEGPARSVHVVPCGVDKRMLSGIGQPSSDEAVLRGMGLGDRPFVFTVLGGKRYKNQANLAKAAEELKQVGHDIDVAVAGDAELVFRELAYPPNLKVLGVVSDAVLATLYRNARAFVFPTLFEGFGMPVIEAQAAGLPVVCSDLPVLRETGGDGAVYVDPRSPKAIAGGIVRLMEDEILRNTLVTQGFANAAQYTWRRTADAFLDACDRV